MKEVILPSKGILKIQISPFAVSKALFHAVLKESKTVSLDAGRTQMDVVKELFCVGFSSLEIEKCLWDCFARCTIDYGKGPFKIDENMFEPVNQREDYLKVCAEVAKENILPFAKSLTAEYPQLLKILENSQQ